MTLRIEKGDGDSGPPFSSYDTWLRAADVPMSLLFGVALSFGFAFAKAGWTTPVAYAVSAVLILWRGRFSIRRPLLGDWPTWKTILVVLAISAIAFLFQMFFPQLYCLYPGCNSAARIDELHGIAFSAIVLSPILETLVFQGWLQTRLEEMLGVWVAIILTGLLFTAIHAGLSLMIVFMALSLCWLRSQSKSLLAVFAAHLGANLAVLVLMLRA